VLSNNKSYHNIIDSIYIQVSMMKLQDYDCIGFDMDHTFLQYHLPNVFKLIYSSVVNHLVKDKGYNEDLLHFDNFTKFEDFSLRGLILDLLKGNFIKIDPNGVVLCASHGMKSLTEEEIVKDYGPDKTWPLISVLKEKVFHSDGYALIENFFLMPAASIAGQLIEDADKNNNGRLDDYTTIWKEVTAALILNFDFLSFKKSSGIFFPSIIKDTSTYVKKCSKQLIDWVKMLKENGKTTMLITDSYGNFSNLLMEYAVGKDWKELFDFIVVYANKPNFFKEEFKDRPFYKIDDEFEMSSTEVEQLDSNTIYARGNARKLENVLKKHTSNENPKIIYFGDSMKSDVYPPNHHMKWHTVAVLEELEAEDVIANNQQNYEPHLKRAKVCPLLKEEKLLIASKQWGSFFCHKVDGKSYDTFWMDLVKSHSKLSTPALDHLISNPIEFEYETFNKDATTSGFYPFLPKSIMEDNIDVNK